MTRGTPAGVRLTHEGAIAIVTLDRPEKHNALGAADVASFRDMLDDIEATPETRVVMLTGAGDRTFSAGASLDEMKSGDMSGAVFETLTDRLAHFALPTVCALNGDVYGGGGELALCCDFRVGEATTTVRVTAAKLGVCYPAGGLTRYVRRLGLPVANRLLLAAEPMTGEELYLFGYLTHLAPAGEVREKARSLCDQLAGLAPLAVRSMKSLMLEAAHGVIDEERAALLITTCSESSDLAEGLTAWREGRDPTFKGE
jgi:enoyl-CoA hydratase/carnithine racemase